MRNINDLREIFTIHSKIEVVAFIIITTIFFGFHPSGQFKEWAFTVGTLLFLKCCALISIIMMQTEGE